MANLWASEEKVSAFGDDGHHTAPPTIPPPAAHVKPVAKPRPLPPPPEEPCAIPGYPPITSGAIAKTPDAPPAPGWAKYGDVWNMPGLNPYAGRF